MVDCNKDCIPKMRCKDTKTNTPCEKGMKIMMKSQGKEVLYTDPSGSVKQRTVHNYVLIDNLKYEIYSPIPKWKSWIMTKLLGYTVS